MFVSSSPSKSLSLRLPLPVVRGRVGDRDVLVASDVTLSAGDMVPDWVRGLSMGALDCVRATDGLALGGRIECFFRGTVAPMRGKPAMQMGGVSSAGTIVKRLCISS